MRVLLGCEESQAVCIEFRKLGHEAYSCDTEPCSGGHPEWHIQADVMTVINGGLFTTEDGGAVLIEKWDMGIFFTPCTYSCNSGLRWMYYEDWTTPSATAFYTKRINETRMENCKKYATMLRDVLLSDIPMVCCENPIPHHFAVSFIGGGYDQLIQPWQFGHGETKATCLWLKGLPFLQYTKIVKGREARIHKMGPSKNGGRAKARSKTFPGIAKAMASQWSEISNRHPHTIIFNKITNRPPSQTYLPL